MKRAISHSIDDLVAKLREREQLLVSLAEENCKLQLDQVTSEEQNLHECLLGMEKTRSSITKYLNE